MPIGFRNQYQTIQSPSNYDPLADARNVLTTTPDYAEMWEKRRARRDAQVNSLRSLMASRPDFYKGAEVNVSQWGEVQGNEAFRNAGKLTKKNDLNQQMVDEQDKYRIDTDKEQLDLAKQIGELDKGLKGEELKEQQEIRDAIYTEGKVNRTDALENAVDDANSNLNTNQSTRIKEAVDTLNGLNPSTSTPSGTTTTTNPYTFGNVPPPADYVTAPEPEPSAPVVDPNATTITKTDKDGNVTTVTGTGDKNLRTSESESIGGRKGINVGQNGRYETTREIEGGYSMKGAPMYETRTRQASGIVDEDIGDYGSYLNQAQLAQINSMNANLLHGASPSDGGWGDVAARRQAFVERNMGKWLGRDEAGNPIQPTEHITQEGGSTVSYDKIKLKTQEGFGQTSSTNIINTLTGGNSSATGYSNPGGGANDLAGKTGVINVNGVPVNTEPQIINGREVHTFGGGTTDLWSTPQQQASMKEWLVNLLGSSDESWNAYNYGTGGAYYSKAKDFLKQGMSLKELTDKIGKNGGLMLKDGSGNVIKLRSAKNNKGQYVYAIAKGTILDPTLSSTLLGTASIGKEGTVQSESKQEHDKGTGG